MLDREPMGKCLAVDGSLQGFGFGRQRHDPNYMNFSARKEEGRQGRISCANNVMCTMVAFAFAN